MLHFPKQGGAGTHSRGCKAISAYRFDQASLLLTRMIDVRAWAEYVVEWAAKDPYGFLTTVILALTPLFIASALLSWKLAKMIEARDREQKKKQKRQENIAKAKRTKKD
ncbi:small integral membrane protein 15 isoform 2-T2 [Spinachia spinachia]